jgi:hypothetical protein
MTYNNLNLLPEGLYWSSTEDTVFSNNPKDNAMSVDIRKNSQGDVIEDTPKSKTDGVRCSRRLT